MTIEVRYRTINDNTINEAVVHLDPADRDELLRILTTEALFGAVLHHRESSTDTVEAPDHELIVGFHGDLGALYYTDEFGSWYTLGPTPEDDGPVYAEVDFPRYSELPAADVTQAITQFIDSDGQRPNCVTWQDDPYAT
ncbi:MAG: Imm1 family immunity protein [Actinomycetota bacterium]|nr:Imm1 family immunity protein [Actinomycetota bacterium]